MFSPAGPARHRPDRHRQDGSGLQAAHAAAPRGPCAQLQTDDLLRSLILSPTRELATQIAESFCTYGRNLKSPVSPSSAASAIKRGLRAARRRRHPRRHARPSASTTCARQCPFRPHRDLRPRRGRPDARHGLHPATSASWSWVCRASARACSSRPPCRTRSAAGGRIADRSGARRGDAGRHDRRTDPPARRVHEPGRIQERRLAEALRSPEMTRSPSSPRMGKHGADKVVRYLEQQGIPAAAIHGNKSQSNRERAPASFKKGRDQGAGRHRHRGARHRHRRGEPRRELSPAQHSQNPTSIASAAPRAGRQASLSSFCDNEGSGPSCATSSG